MLLLIFSSIVAKVKIDPRIGPIQGVQPNPKAIPTSNGKTKLFGWFMLSIIYSGRENDHTIYQFNYG